MLARDIMTKDVLIVSPVMTIPNVAQFFIDNNISGAPVVDEKGSMIGIITEDDLIFQDKKVHMPTVINILGAVIYLENFKHFDEELKKIIGTFVRDVMTKDVVTVTEETDIAEIAAMMTDKKIYLFPVMRDGAIVGIVGKYDLVKAMVG